MDLGTFDVDAYKHYSNSLNGNVNTVVPGKILLFPSPVPLPDGKPWMDFAGGVRRFSAPFYADLLSSEFNVFLVACVDSADYDRAAFAAHGIETEDMPLDGGPNLLRVMDRFLAVAAAADGAIALHYGAGPARGLSCALVASYLVRHGGFSAEAAVAWVRMAHPTLLLPAAASAAAASGVTRHVGLLPSFLRSESMRCLGAARGGDGGGGRKLTRSASGPERLQVLSEAPDVFDFC